jgi:septum formation protein
VITEKNPLLLGSASPRRSAILASLGIPFVVLPADIDEDVHPGEPPLGYLERIVEAKLAAVWSRLEVDGLSGAVSVAAVLVADTIVVLDETIVGKPADVADAQVTLARLVGRTHTVFTRYLLGRHVRTRSGQQHLGARTVRTEVKLRDATPDEVEAYARTGEGLDKAGAYAAQGIGAFLVEGLAGSYSNVVGLPACELITDLQQSGLLGVFPKAVAEL